MSTLPFESVAALAISSDSLKVPLASVKSSFEASSSSTTATAAFGASPLYAPAKTLSGSPATGNGLESASVIAGLAVGLASAGRRPRAS